MANYQQLKNALVDVIKQNGNNEITGEIMQTTLLSMINSLGANYQFAGVLTPSTSFIPTDENIFYIGGAGSYSNFGASTINVPTGCICIFTYNGSFASSNLYVGGVVNISKLTNNSYTSLSQALADVPSFLQVGGLEIMYQDSASGNYVKYRLMATSWSTAETNWQGVDEKPIAGSKNVVESGGVAQNIQNLNGNYNVDKQFPSGESFPFSDVYLRRGEKLTITVATSGTLTNLNFFVLKKRGSSSSLLTIVVNSAGESVYNYTITEDGNYYIRAYINDTIEYSLSLKFNSRTQDGKKIRQLYNCIGDEIFNAGATSHTERIPIEHSRDFYIETSGIEPNQSFTIYWFTSTGGNISSTNVTKNGILQVALNTDAYYYQIYKNNQTSAAVNIKIHTKDIIGGINLDIQNNIQNTNMRIDELYSIEETIATGTPTTTYPYFPLIETTRILYCKVDSLAGCEKIALYINRAQSSVIKTVWVNADNVNQWIRTTADENIVGIAVQMIGSAPSADIHLSYCLTPNLQFVFEALGKGISLNLMGKKAAFCGDSIMKADSDRAHQGGWAEIIGGLNSMSYQNFGVSGATIGRSADTSRPCIQDQVTALDSSWDYIIIQGGCNDIPTNVPLGEISATYDAEFDTSTLYGALEYLCKYLMENHSNKKYGFIITYRFGQNNSQTDNDLRMDAIKNVCDKWCCPYIDLRKEAGFNLVCKDLRIVYGVPLAAIPLYSTTANYAVDDKVKRIVGEDYITYKANTAIAAPAGEFDESKWTQISDGEDYDSWHANHVAYEQSSPKVQSWMETL